MFQIYHRELTKDWYGTLFVSTVFWLDSKLKSKDFWSQDPYILYVVVVLVGLDSKILLQNGQNWKLPKIKVAKVAKIAKIESCQICQICKLLSCELAILEQSPFVLVLSHAHQYLDKKAINLAIHNDGMVVMNMNERHIKAIFFKKNWKQWYILFLHIKLSCTITYYVS